MLTGSADLALTLAHRLWASLDVACLDMHAPQHSEFYTVWRSIVFARSWLGSTIGAIHDEAQLMLPPTVSHISRTKAIRR